MPRIQSLERQTGAAVLMALLVVVIVMAYSTFWFAETRIGVERTDEMIVSEQMHLYAEFISCWAMEALSAETAFPKVFILPDFEGRGVLLLGRIEKYSDARRGAPSPGVSMKQAAAGSPSGQFLLRAEVRTADRRFVLYTLFERQWRDRKPAVRRVWQARGFFSGNL